MIELYITTSDVPSSTEEIVKLLYDNNVECQVMESCCSFKCGGGTENLSLEKGYYINLFNVLSCEFKEKVWEVLAPFLNLSCAYVKDEGRYVGCIKNWPCVFRGSDCTHTIVTL